jgi:hypothetical protein
MFRDLKIVDELKMFTNFKNVHASKNVKKILMSFKKEKKKKKRKKLIK